MAYLRENKDRFIDSNPNLTYPQKEEIKAYFQSHSNQESLVDWNNYRKLTYDDFLKVMKSVSTSAQKKYRVFDVKEGEDYIRLGNSVYRGNPVEVYEPLTWKGSCALASNQFGPEIWSKVPSWIESDEANSWGKSRGDEEGLKPGAKWCISMHTTKKHWVDYVSEFEFIFIFNPMALTDRNKKIAITVNRINKNVEQVNDALDDFVDPGEDIMNITQFFADDLRPTEVEPPPEFVFNKETGRYDVSPEFNCGIAWRYIRNGDFIFPLGVFPGYLDLSDSCYITSLKNFPTEIHGGLNLQNQAGIKSLVGCPKYIDGDFSVSWTSIKDFTGLEDTEITGDFRASYCNLLKSTKNFPKKVGGLIQMDGNKNLTALEDLPEKALSSFTMRQCPNLKSLKGCPKKVRGDFRISRSGITSLEGGPEVVYDDYVCDFIPITSLKGIAKKVGTLSAIGCRLDPLDLYAPEDIEDEKYYGIKTEGMKPFIKD